MRCASEGGRLKEFKRLKMQDFLAPPSPCILQPRDPDRAMRCKMQGGGLSPAGAVRRA